PSFPVDAIQLDRKSQIRPDRDRDARLRFAEECRSVPKQLRRLLWRRAQFPLGPSSARTRRSCRRLAGRLELASARSRQRPVCPLAIQFLTPANLESDQLLAWSISSASLCPSNARTDPRRAR